jgi:hypothetical protein
MNTMFTFLGSLFASSTPGAATAAPAPAPATYIEYSRLEPKCREVMAELYGEALFLQPNGSLLSYSAVAYPFKSGIAVPADSPNWQIYEIYPNYAPAFKVGMKIRFSDLDTNIEANWQRLYTSKSEKHTVPTSGDMIGPLFDIGPNSSAYSISTGEVKFHFDSANLLFAQQFCAFKRLYPNIFAGGSYARIKQTLNNKYENYSSGISREIESYSTFTGAGPMIGFDFDYRVYGGFFFTGTSSLALIIGESQNGTTYTSATPALTTVGNPNPNIQGTKVPNRTQLVPALEEKLGFSYGGLFSSCSITFGFGYQAQIYLNAIQSVDMQSQAAPELLTVLVPDSGVFAQGFLRTLSNYIMTGPYITLDIVF